MDIINGTQIRTFEGHNGKVISVDFNSDGTKLVSGSIDRQLNYGCW